MSSSTGTVVFNDAKIQSVDVVATEGLGVGTINPQSNLHVVGNAYVTSNMVIDDTLDVTGEMNLRAVSNTASIKYNSNVVTEYVRSKKLIKYPRVKMTGAVTSGYVASASSENNGTTTGQAWRAFDGVAGGERGYHSAAGAYSTGVYIGTASVTDVNNTVYDGEWIKLQLPTGERIKVMGAYFYPRTEGNTGYVKRSPYKGYILGSNTGSNGSWNLITSFDGIISTVSSPGIYMFNNNTNDYYNHIALVANEIYPDASFGDVLNFAELEYFALPEYDPEAHGTDVITRSVPNVPNTDWLEVYYDGQDYTSMPSTVTDKSGNGRTGTPNNGVTFDSTWKAFTFDGASDQYINITNVGNPAGNWSHSVSFWVKPQYDGSGNDVVFRLGPGANNEAIGFLYNSAAISYYFYGNDFSQTYTLLDKWYHITLTYNGNTRTIYINGGEETFYTTSGGGQLTLGGNDGMRIGTNESGSAPMTGSIANFRLFNRALSADEVWHLYAYQKEYFQVSPDVVTFKGGRLGVGTEEPRATLDVRGDIRGGCPVFFDVSRSNSLGNLSGGQTVIFDVVRANKGGGYDRNTGVFIAPIAGYYRFFAYGLSTEGGVLSIEFRRNGDGANDKLMRTYGEASTTEWDSASMSMIYYMDVGDTMRLYNNGNFYTAASGIFYNAFQGFFLSI